MKKITLGYLFNEANLKKEDKIFLELAKKKNIELIMINTDKYLKEEELEEKIKQCDIFFNNGGDIFSQELAKQIEELGKKVVESSNKYYYDDDKWMFFVKCDKHKIPTPKTILLAENLNMAKREVKEFNQWPVILKRIEGTWGEYVAKAENLDEVEKIINKFWKKGSEKLPIIAQEFIDSPSYRVTVIGDKIVQTALKENKGWKATGIYAHHFKRFKIDSELKK